MRGRPLRVRWTHTVEDLVARIQQEPDPRRRQRLQALLLLRAGQRLTDVSETLGVHYRTVQRWVDWYRTGGLDAVLEIGRASCRGNGRTDVGRARARAL